MKKLLTGIVVLSLASVAFAVPAFDINGGTTVQFNVGESKVVPVVVSGATGIAGMTLNLELSGKFEITDLVIDKDANGLPVSGLVFALNTTGAVIFTQFKPLPDGEGGFIQVPANLAFGSVTTNSGTVNANPGTVGLVTIKAVGAVGDTGTAVTSEDSDVLDSGGNGLMAGRASTGLLIIPEPISALLLLAGLPLIRRRRA